MAIRNTLDRICFAVHSICCSMATVLALAALVVGSLDPEERSLLLQVSASRFESEETNNSTIDLRPFHHRPAYGTHISYRKRQS